MIQPNARLVSVRVFEIGQHEPNTVMDHIHVALSHLPPALRYLDENLFHSLEGGRCSLR